MLHAESRPLHELAHLAPAISPPSPLNDVLYPFSNDDSIRSFREALRRTDTEAYQQAKNRVAIVVGESALSTAIHWIPEETIVLLDDDEPMVGYMGGYVDALRTAPSPREWGRQMGVIPPGASKPRRDALLRQLDWWEQQGVPHALADSEVFAQSRALAREKAIIPWRGDVTSVEDMAHLGDTLRGLDAAVTLLNLSNVIAYGAYYADEGHASFPSAAGYADVLDHLPLTPDAPILTTSMYGIGNTKIASSTGPFYGLTDLRERGGDSKDGPVAVPANELGSLGFGDMPLVVIFIPRSQRPPQQPK